MGHLQIQVDCFVVRRFIVPSPEPCQWQWECPSSVVCCALLLVPETSRNPCERPIRLLSRQACQRDMAGTVLPIIRAANGQFTIDFDVCNELTPIGPHVLKAAFFTLFIAWPEYLTTLCIVNAGSPMLATL